MAYMLHWDQTNYLLIVLSLKITCISEHIEYFNITKKNLRLLSVLLLFLISCRNLIFGDFVWNFDYEKKSEHIAKSIIKQILIKKKICPRVSYGLNGREKSTILAMIQWSAPHTAIFVLLRSVMIGFGLLLILTINCANGLCKLMFYCW